MGGWPLALNVGVNQYTCPACGTKKCFIAAAVAGDITTNVIKGRQPRPMSSLILLDAYGSTIYRPILAANEAWHLEGWSSILEGVGCSTYASLDADFCH